MMEIFYKIQLAIYQALLAFTEDIWKHEKIDKPHPTVHQGVYRGGKRNAETSFDPGGILGSDRAEPEKVWASKREKMNYLCIVLRCTPMRPELDGPFGCGSI